MPGSAASAAAIAARWARRRCSASRASCASYAFCSFCSEAISDSRPDFRLSACARPFSIAALFAAFCDFSSAARRSAFDERLLALLELGARLAQLDDHGAQLAGRALEHVDRPEHVLERVGGEHGRHRVGVAGAVGDDELRRQVALATLDVRLRGRDLVLVVRDLRLDALELFRGLVVGLDRRLDLLTQRLDLRLRGLCCCALGGNGVLRSGERCRPGGAEGCERYEGDEEMASKTEQEEDLPVGLVRIARGIDRLIETGQGLNQKASKADG